MEQGKNIFKNKWFWISLIGGLIIIGGIAYALVNKGDEDVPETPPAQPPTTPPTTPPSPPAPPTPPTPPAPPSGGQILKTYTCETKKVCQGREGYTNWVKTGNQKKCNCSNVCQGLCLSDCNGTCYTFEKT